jgi:hypothetical protein
MAPYLVPSMRSKIALVTAAAAQLLATVNTNGMSKGYIARTDGEEICRDPMIWLQFRRPEKTTSSAHD